MTTYRTIVKAEQPSGVPFFAYHGHCVALALERAEDYTWCPVVKVEYQHADGTWRTVTSRECK